MAITQTAPTESKAPEKTRIFGLGTFFALSFAMTWGIAALLMFAPDLVGEAGLGNPIYVLAVWAPAVAGIIVAWQRLGLRGVGRMLARFGMVRMQASGWWFLAVGVPAIVFAGAVVAGTAGDAPVFSPWYSAVSAVLAAFFLAGTVEEIGWRGVALPLLQRRFSPIVAGLLLGIAWAGWHLPAFALSGTVQSAWALGPYVAGLLSVSVIMTWLFNASKGSLLIAWVMHFQLMNPLFPDAQPWDTLFYVAAAVTVVIADRTRMFRRGAGVAELERTDSRG